jgi:hypothetical protein
LLVSNYPRFFIAAYAASRVNAKINEVQKQIGPKKKAYASPLAVSIARF